MDERDTFFDSGYEWEVTSILRETEGQDADGWLTSWRVVEAKNEDGDKKYFVIEEDAGYADWGPLDTPKEAIEWLLHKWDDVDEDEKEYDDDYIPEAECEECDESFDLAEVEVDDDFIASLSDAPVVTAEVVEEEPKEDKPPQTPEENGLATTLNKLIVGELDTINDYNAAIQQCKDWGFEDQIPSLEDIVKEEHVHIGQLQELLKTVSSNANAIEQGEEEGAEQIAKAETEEGMATVYASDDDAFVDAEDFVEID